jgi:phage head maturation protease
MPKATFSTEDINSFGFRVRTSGIKLDRYLKNPVLTFGHDTNKMSVGKAIALAVANNNLVGDVEFDLEDEIGKSLDRKYNKGYMCGFSIGVRVITFNWDKEVPELEESELLEIAAATVPSNENAVTLFNEKGEMVELSYFNKKTNLKDMKKIAILLGLAYDATEAEIEKAIVDLKALLAAKEAEAKNLSAQIQIVKDVEKADKNKRLDLALNNPKKNLSDEQKANYKKLAESDVDTVISIVNALTDAVKLHTIPGVKTQGKFEGKTFDDLHKSGMLAELKASDFEAYADLYEAKYHKRPVK